MILVVGLGNPGPRYRGTRHNLGRAVVERLAAESGVRLAEDGWARAGRPRIGTTTVTLAIPETFMNESGVAVRDLLHRRRRRPADLLIVHDDLDLPLGHLRLRPGNGAGGHNGIRSIIDEIGTGAFPRLRIGIGRPPVGIDPAEFVLERFLSGERPQIEEAVSRAVEAVVAVAREGLEAAMSRFNRRPTPPAAATAP
ncbi:MAG TPA: aminoacyl-tRNA hydrolase [bacterium]|nr:aminoacyl-tRNA hydrolase [bacterium]